MLLVLLLSTFSAVSSQDCPPCEQMLNVNYNQKMINVSTKNSGPQLGLEKEKMVCECIRCPIHTDAYYF